MTEYDFNHVDILTRLNNRFEKGEWVDVYRSESYQDSEHSEINIFRVQRCYLASDDVIGECLEDEAPDLNEDEKCAYYTSGEFRSFAKPGFEPLFTVRSFTINKIHHVQIRICEDFVLLFNLYEKRNNDESFIDYVCFNDDEEITVVQIRQNSVKILHRYLTEYLCIKQMNLVCVAKSEVNCPLSKKDLLPFKYEYTGPTGKVVESPKEAIYNRSNTVTGFEFQSWLAGKRIVRYRERGSFVSVFDNEYADFIIGYNTETCKNIMQNCSSYTENMRYEKVYFKKDVVEKYRFEEDFKYEPFNLSTSVFSIKCDNDCDGYIVVELNQLSRLPYKEQLHWQSFNVVNPGISNSQAFDIRFKKGSWERIPYASIDLQFVELFRDLQNQWTKIFEWPLFKPTQNLQANILYKLFLLSKSEYGYFDNLVKNFNLLLSDSINVEMLNKSDITYQKGAKAISRLETFLEGQDKPIKTTLFIPFLRKLNDLRSKLTSTHRQNGDFSCEEMKMQFDFLGISSVDLDWRAASITLFKKANAAFKELIDILQNK